MSRLRAKLLRNRTYDWCEVIATRTVSQSTHKIGNCGIEKDEQRVLLG